MATHILTIQNFKQHLITEGRKSDEEKLAKLKKQLADWDEEHESELAKKRKGSSLKKKESLRKRIMKLQKKLKKDQDSEQES